MIKSRFVSLVLILAYALSLSGCEQGSMSSSAAHQAGFFTSYIQMAPNAPPPLREEDVPPAENVRTEVWRPGHWDYSGTGYDWVSGHMMARPAPTAIWSPDHWIEHTYGWAFIPGYWQ